MQRVLGRSRGGSAPGIPGRGKGWRPWLVAVVAGLLWFGMAWTASADMRIVTDENGVRTELLLKKDRIASSMAGGERVLLACDTGELTIVSPRGGGRYWQGTAEDFQKSLSEMFQSVLGGAEGMPDLSGILGDLFGKQQDAGEIQVRVVKAGEDTVAGYRAEHYRVETGDGTGWQVHEEMWISRDLLREVRGEVGDCIMLLSEMGHQMAAAVPMPDPELEAVLASPDYRRLTEEGFPVRSRSSYEVFGTATDISSELVEVDRGPVPEDAFTVPAGYQRVGSPLELFSGS